MAEVVLAFWTHAQTYDRHANGRPTGEVENLRHVLAPLRKLYGRLPAADFSPLKLKAVQDHMIGLRWCRRHINCNVGRIKHVFKGGPVFKWDPDFGDYEIVGVVSQYGFSQATALPGFCVFER